MNSQENREIRSFLVGRDPSVDRRFRPCPDRQVRLFDEIGEISDEEELNDENIDPQTSSESCQLSGGADSTTSENALVYLRMRPLKISSNLYTLQGNVIIVKPSKCSDSSSNNKNCLERHFVFTDIFNPEIPQFRVYDNCVRHQIDSEESFTLLTYGTSNSGKTYTLLGNKNDPGLVPRALQHIFTIYEANIYPSPSIKLVNGRIMLVEDNDLLPDLELRKRLLGDCVETPEMSNARSIINTEHIFKIPNKSNDVSVLIWISFVEIYNENVYDLLEPVAPNVNQKALPRRKNLKIVGNDGKAFIKDLTCVYVKSSVEALYLLNFGLQRVSYASTSINSNSSRSHCIFIVDVLKFFRSGQFSETSYKFCDLAGSERLTKTKNVGSRLNEAKCINTSLLVLGRCLEASSNKKSNDLIPFRESKLTTLIQAPLMGKEKITMIVNLMPTEMFHEENLNVLNFASIAKNIVFSKPKPKASKRRCSFLLDNWNNNNDARIKQLLEENIFLRDQVDKLNSQIQEKDASHAAELFNLERDIRMEICDIHQENIKIMKETFEAKLKFELGQQKRKLEDEYDKVIRRLEWKIEDLEEELKGDGQNERHSLG